MADIKPPTGTCPEVKPLTKGIEDLSLQGRKKELIKICNIKVTSLLHKDQTCHGIPKAELKFFCLLFEMSEKEIDIMCVTNHRWTGQGYFNYTYSKGKSYHIYYNNNNKEKYGGVAIIISDRLQNYGPHINFYTTSDISRASNRVVRIRFNGLDIIAIIAPSQQMRRERNNFNHELKHAVDNGSQSLILMGDFSTWHTDCRNGPFGLTHWFNEGFYHVCGRGVDITNGKVVPIVEAEIDIAGQRISPPAGADAPIKSTLTEKKKLLLHELLMVDGKDFTEIKQVPNTFLTNLAKKIRNAK